MKCNACLEGRAVATTCGHMFTLAPAIVAAVLDGRRGAEWGDGLMCFRKEVPSERKSAKAASAGKAAKDGEKTPKASKSIAADKEEATSAFDFDDEGVEAPAAKK